MARIRVKQVRSAIGRNVRQKRTIRALGIRRMNQVVEHEDTASVRGMVQKVIHLVKVEPAE